MERKEAKALGSKFDFTGRECKNGHVAERRTSDGRCLECEKLFNKRYRERDLKSRRAAERKRYHDNPGRRYGLSREEFDRVVGSGCCAICNEPSSIDKRHAIDHDHSCCDSKPVCGKCVRGLLCDACNRGLGYFKDSIEHLLNAVRYLRRHQSG